MSLREQLKNVLLVQAEIDLDLLDVSDEDGEDDLYEELTEDLSLLASQRYLQFNNPVLKSTAWINTILPNLDDKRFKSILRINRAQFSLILDLLEQDTMFLTTKLQFPVAVQLAITLYRLGSYGSGCSLAKMATLFGIGDGGTIGRITTRVFQGLLKHEKKFIFWPTEEERLKITNEIGDSLPNCVGYLDGSEFNLAEAPSLDHSSYFSRKQRYSIKAQVICDNDLRIRYVHVGYPGSTHDARIFANSDIGLHTKEYLSGAQWLAADSAYKLTDTVITPFRNNSRFRTLKDREKFNKYFSSFRVKIEMCFGILKEKFSSLKELRTNIKNQHAHAFVCDWIRVCMLLHNMLLPYYDEGDFIYQQEVDANNGNDDNNSTEEVAGSAKRAALFDLLEDKL